MNASKASCKHALENLIGQERFMNAYAFKTIKKFLEAAMKRLPSEEAIAKDKKRKRAQVRKREPEQP